MKWKNVVGYENLYLVSDTGIIKALKKVRGMPCQWDGVKNKGSRIYPEKIMIYQTDKDGYFRVKLFKESIAQHYRVNRIVAIAFIPNPENKPLVNHKDGNKQNNSVSNLEWATNRENLDHAMNTGLMKDIRKFTESDVIRIKTLHKSGLITAKEVAAEFNCHVNYVYLIFENKRWKHIKI